jgi:hypothetical protein
MSDNKYMDDERFDGLYLNVAHTTKGIEPLLDTVFSFLRRKTDFFSGPPGSNDGGEAAIAKVHAVLQKHANLYTKNKKKASNATKPKTMKAESKVGVSKQAPEVIEMGKGGDFDVSVLATEGKKDSSKADKALSSPSLQDEKLKPTKEVMTDPDDEKRGPPPVGNGGSVDGKYTWTQLLAEVNLTIAVPENTRGRDLNISIAKKHLKVGLRAQPGRWIIDAPLVKPVIIDDSFWTVEDGNRLVINLQKLNQMEWWDGVCEGDPKIDVRAIQPESSSLGDLDGDTRKTVEKMMYDQRQKAMGLPSSEEEQKLSMLDKFKQQHPELDFSNAKMN